MSADLLRRAAALMRERAEAAPAGRWGVDEVDAVWVSHDPEWQSSSCLVESFPIWADGAGEHIASWHPAVALAVADWLDAAEEAFADIESWCGPGVIEPTLVEAAALAVARAYLGEDG